MTLTNLSIIIMVGKINILSFLICDDEGLMGVKLNPTPVREQQAGQRCQVITSELGYKVIKPQFIQFDLCGKRKMLV